MDFQEKMSKCIDEIAIWTKADQMKFNTSKKNSFGFQYVKAYANC